MPDRKNRRVTIKDIARQAGVHPSTVTRALQDSPRVKASTREAIKKIAVRIGYVPSAMARSLVTRRSDLIGLVIPDMTNPFFAPLTRGIEDEAGRHGRRVLIRNTEGDRASERDAINVFTELAVDGLLVPSACCSKSYYASLRGSTPIVHINQPDAKHHVSCDMGMGAAAIMRHLIDLGHRRIAFVSGPGAMVGEPKRTAYSDVLAASGLTERKDDYFDFDGAMQSVYVIARQLARREDRPTAIFAWNDQCAIALIHALNKEGIDVPGEISVAGHDDVELAGIINPPLTTVRWPMYHLGVQSVRYAMQLHSDNKPEATLIPYPALKVRESTAPPCA